MESVILDYFPSYVYEKTTRFLSVRDECVAKQIVLVSLRSQNSLVEEALRMQIRSHHTDCLRRWECQLISC